MARKEITNEYGIKFYIEPNYDFGDDGIIRVVKGVFAGLIDGTCDLSGVFFEDEGAAVSAISTYGG